MKSRQTSSLPVLELLATAALAQCVAAQTNKTQSSTRPDQLTLTWTGDPSTSITISWRTATSTTIGKVEYCKAFAFDGEVKTATVPATVFTTDLGDVHLYQVTLTGLRPNTRYTYRVGSSASWSNQCTFTTADPRISRFKFLVFGDSQSGSVKPNYAPWAKTVHNAYQRNKDARFIMNCGDLVEVGQSYAHWIEWYKSAAGVIDTIPEMAIQGNHETYPADKNGRANKPLYWLNQFALPQNGPVGLKEQVYSFTYGNVHIAVLDSQQDEESPKFGDILEAQKQWLEADLASSKSRWKIVCFHKTPYDIKRSRNNPTIKQAFCPIIERHHVDTVFNGHDHGVAYTYPMSNDMAMPSSAQGTIYYIVGRSGAKSYPDLEKKKEDAFFYDPQDQPNYITVEVDDRRFTVRAFKQDGHLIDTLTISK